jgi:sulfatase modifying factor 1
MLGMRRALESRAVYLALVLLGTACAAPAPVASPDNTQCVSPQEATVASPVVVPRGPKQIRIEGGSFLMGTDTGPYPEAKPAHRVTVATFYMDETEVSVDQYAGCVKAGVCQPQKSALSDRRANNRGARATLEMDNESCNFERPGRERHPMNCVDWYQASRFCAWLGRRLPTEQEWEFAARGPEGRTYPWGEEEPTAERANISGEEEGLVFRRREVGWSYRKGWHDGYQTTAPVDSFPAGRTPQGVYGLGGNVSEWTASHDCKYSGLPCTQQLYVCRGDSFVSYNEFPAWERGAGVPMLRGSYNGFRCAREAPSAYPLK